MDKARYRIRHEYTTLGAGAAYSRQKGRLWLRHEYTTLGPALHTRARWDGAIYSRQMGYALVKARVHHAWACAAYSRKMGI